jgi:hypothetical protein
MSGHDGPDISAVYQLLSEVARIVAGHDRRFDERGRWFDEHTGKLNELIAVVNGHSSKLDELAAIVNAHDRKFDDLSADLAGLRETLTHASVLGHGILISELEERVRRIERSASRPASS